MDIKNTQDMEQLAIINKTIIAFAKYLNTNVGTIPNMGSEVQIRIGSWILHKAKELGVEIG